MVCLTTGTRSGRRSERRFEMTNKEMILEIKRVEPMLDHIKDVAMEIIKSNYDITSVGDILISDTDICILFEDSWGHNAITIPIEWFDEGFDYKSALFRKQARERAKKKEYETFLKLKKKYEANEEAKGKEK
jgi:hypothetical protein